MDFVSGQCASLHKTSSSYLPIDLSHTGKCIVQFFFFYITVTDLTMTHLFQVYSRLMKKFKQQPLPRYVIRFDTPNQQSWVCADWVALSQMKEQL